MTTPGASSGGATTADRMEAAAWIAKLHGSERSPELEAGFRRWLNESEAHRGAFEMANELWSDLAAIPKSDHPIQVRFKRKSWAGSAAHPRRALLAAATVAGISLIAAFWFLREPVIATEVGERRTFALNDGSEVTLNTATRIRLDYTDKQRYLQLQRGEALFKVAKDPSRPFVVSIGDRKIVALGTAFLARRDSGGRITVTLIDGKVSVSTPELQSPAIPSAAATKSTVLSPGQRLTLVRNEKPRLDRPALKNVAAWQQGQVNLDHTSLTDAIAEINRYSTTQIVLEQSGGAAPGNIEITGIFRAGEPEEFARAIATTYNLKIQERAGAIILSADN